MRTGIGLTCWLLLCCFISICGAAWAAEPASKPPVADKAAPVQPGDVHLTGWLGSRIDANWKGRLMTVDLNERLNPFKNPAEREGWSGEHVGKWLHAASITWQYTRDPALRRRMDEAVTTLISCQSPDGYLGTYAMKNRWGGWDVWTHKYNLIGLLSYYEATGDRRALDSARRIGDLLINTFGEGKRDIIASGTHVGMAATSVLEPVVLLARDSGDPRYLEFARYIVRAYDQPNGPKIIESLLKTHSVVKTANAKAYEMMSNVVGLCELYRQTGERRYLEPCLIAYEDIVANQMYITGGVSLGEHFQQPHHLPNTGAVSENCAQVTWLQLCIQLLRLTGDAKYADTIERIAYNHLLASQKPSGEALCYFTPLQGKKPYGAGMNCCTSSGPRGIALLTTIAYTTGPRSVQVNFFEPSTLETKIDGVKVKIMQQQTDYLVDGVVRFAIEPEKPVAFDLLIRRPRWGRAFTVQVNDEFPPREVPLVRDYLRLSREWRKGETVRVKFDVFSELAHGRGTNQGLVAYERGPFVFAIDAGMNPGVSLARITHAAYPDRVFGGWMADVKVAVVSGPRRADAGEATCVVRGLGLTPTGDGSASQTRLKTVPLQWTIFADAGATGSNFAVWLPSPERLSKMAAAPFLSAKESWSRKGNVEASIADGDTSTWRVTFDGKPQPEDWFAVERERLATINSVVFAHGHVYHDGGWFDASKGKPRIQIKKTPAGAWEDLAVIVGYPATTATDATGLADGQEFAVRVPAVQAAGIRVIGVPACGDNAKQSFASCAELQGHLDTAK